MLVFGIEPKLAGVCEPGEGGWSCRSFAGTGEGESEVWCASVVGAGARGRTTCKFEACSTVMPEARIASEAEASEETEGNRDRSAMPGGPGQPGVGLRFCGGSDRVWKEAADINGDR